MLLLLAGCVGADKTGSTDLMVTIDPADPDTTATLRALVERDGAAFEAPSTAFSWSVDGNSAGTGPEVAADLTTRGQQWTVEVMVDGAKATASTTIVPAPLPVIDVSITPVLPVELVDDLICAADALPDADMDGDRLTYTVHWYRDGAPWTDAEVLTTTVLQGDTVLASALTLGDTWRCTLEFADGTGDLGETSAEVHVEALSTIPRVLVPAGTFWMGSPEEEVGHRDDEALHEVTLTHAFWIGTTELTRQQYTEVMGTPPPPYDGSCAQEDCPVVLWEWSEAALFTNRMSEEAGLPPCHVCAVQGSIGDGETRCVPAHADPYLCRSWRLPTEAEWEYAARDAGTVGGAYPGGGSLDVSYTPEWGCAFGVTLSNGDLLGELAWYCANGESAAHPVAALRPNGLGLFDTSGNLMEWTMDFYQTAGPPGGFDPYVGPVNVQSRPMTRGGQWSSEAEGLRNSYRLSRYHNSSGDAVGVRIARTRLE